MVSKLETQQTMFNPWKFDFKWKGSLLKLGHFAECYSETKQQWPLPFFEIRNTCVRINGASRSCCAAAKRDATKLEKRAWNYNCSGIGPVDIFDQSNFSAFYSIYAVINVNLLFPPPPLSPSSSLSSSPSSSWVADQRHRSCRVTRLSVWVAHISIQPSCNP